MGLSLSLTVGLRVGVREGRRRLARHGVHAGEAHKPALVEALGDAQHVAVACKVIHFVYVYSVLGVWEDEKDAEERVRGEERVGLGLGLERVRGEERNGERRGEGAEGRRGDKAYPLVGHYVVKKGLVLSAADPFKPGRCFLCVSKDELLHEVNVLLTQAFRLKILHKVVLLDEQLKNGNGCVFVGKVVVAQDLGKKATIEEMRKGAVTNIVTQSCELNAQDVLV